MAKEIERKFLVQDGWQQAVFAREDLCDGLLASNRRRKVRVRRSGETATLTVKDQRNGSERNEFEYAIPLADARSIIIVIVSLQKPDTTSRMAAATGLSTNITA